MKNHSKHKIKPFLLVGLFLVFVLSGCGGRTAGEGELAVNLSESNATAALVEPAIDAVTGETSSVLITFNRVAIHKSNGNDADSNWQAVLDNSQPESDRTFDLITLAQGSFELIGITDLAAGDYQQVRVGIEKASFTLNGTTHPLTIPSGVTSGLKFNRGFTIEDGETTTLTLDFDANRSIKADGTGYKLDPVIAVR